MFDGIDTSVQALFVAPVDLLAWAERIRPHIAKMAERSSGRYLTQDIFAELAGGVWLLWVAIEGTDLLCVMVGEIVTYPRMRALRTIGLVGRKPFRWLRFLPAVEDQARRQFGCSMMESYHQPKQIALLRGYKTTHWLSEKSI